MASFPLVSPPTPCAQLPPPTHAPHAPPISLFSIKRHYSVLKDEYPLLGLSQTYSSIRYCYSSWVWNSVSHTKEGTKADGVWEQRAEGDCVSVRVVICAAHRMVLATGCLSLLGETQIIWSLLHIWLFRLSHSFIFFRSYFVSLYSIYGCMFCVLLYNCVKQGSSTRGPPAVFKK
jgi:hypothetical protein